MSGGVTSPNPGTQAPMFRPFPSPYSKPPAGCFDTSNGDDILPGCEMPAMPKPGSADTEGARNDTDTGPAITAVTSNGAAEYNDFIAYGVDTAKNDDSANVDPSSKTARSKLEALRAQGQALSFIAQALLMQIQALNTQVESL